MLETRASYFRRVSPYIWYLAKVLCFFLSQIWNFFHIGTYLLYFYPTPITLILIKKKVWCQIKSNIHIFNRLSTAEFGRQVQPCKNKSQILPFISDWLYLMRWEVLWRSCVQTMPPTLRGKSQWQLEACSQGCSKSFD